MPKTKSLSGKGLHFRVGQWHHKGELQTAIKTSTDPIVHREETLHIVPRQVAGSSTPDARQRTASDQCSQPFNVDLITGYDPDDDTAATAPSTRSIQGPCMLVCLPDGTLSGGGMPLPFLVKTHHRPRRGQRHRPRHRPHHWAPSLYPRGLHPGHRLDPVPLAAAYS